jgi:hypothetical protein
MTEVTEEVTPARRGARIVSWVVLGLLNLAGALLIFYSWLVRLINIDHDSPLVAAIGALFAIAGGLFTALLTGIAVLARWVGRRWFIGPALVTGLGLILWCWPAP